MSIAQELAKRIHAIQFEDLPAEVVPLARTALLEAVGYTFLGSSEEM